MNIKTYVIFYLMFLVMTSCHTEELEDCFDIPLPGSGGPTWGWEYEQRSYNFTSPVFSPADPDVFFYLKSEEGVGEIRLHNLSTNADIFISDKVPYYQIKANVNGALTFNSNDNLVWTVNSDGTGLRVITSIPMTLYPDWSDGGANIIYYKENSVTEFYYIKIDQDGLILDTLDLVTVNTDGTHACSPDGRYLAVRVGNTKKYIYDLSEQSYRVIIHPAFGAGEHSVLSWSQDNAKIIWTTSKGIHVADVSNNTTITIAEGCDSKIYGYASFSADGQSIIASRSDYVKLDNNTLYVESNIVIMNADGSGEKIIDLPQ